MNRFYPAAKINLGLRILGRRPDGFHELSSLLVPLSALHDILDIEPHGGEGLELFCDCDDITDTNLVHKTYNIFCGYTSFFPALRVRLEKKVPVGAGLGGGSSDAACFLRYLAELSPISLGHRELLSLAIKIGSDVPFFLQNSPSLIGGFGEIVTPLEFDLPALHLLLVWPQVHIATAWAFQAYDNQKAGMFHSKLAYDKKNLTKPKVKATQIFPAQNCTIQDILDNLGNDLEEPVFSQYPLLKELKREFLLNGALGAAMSGSGSCIYGIFPDAETAGKAKLHMRAKYNAIYQISI